MATVTLFEISTDRVVLRWEGPARGGAAGGNARSADPQPASQSLPNQSSLSQTPDRGAPPGTLRVTPCRSGAVVLVKALDHPGYVVGAVRGWDPAGGDGETHGETRTGGPYGMVVEEGPQLFEETTYHVAVHSPVGAAVELRHEDPSIFQSLSRFPGSGLLATVNFRSQVGYSRFEVLVDGMPEFAFEVEVFPSKLEYKLDYDAMLAEITNFFVGLALDYLRATYRHGQTVRVPEPSQIEWLTILRQVLEQLESALRRIAQQPRRRLLRRQESVRAERIRRVDSSVRRAVLRGHGRGVYRSVSFGAVREYLPEQRPVESVDTPEHRWLRAQLVDIRYRLATLIREERERLRQLGRQDGAKEGGAGGAEQEGAPQNGTGQSGPNPGVARQGGRIQKSAKARGERVLAELESFESRIAALLRLEPLAEAQGDPPANFSSLLLQAAPGYREAYTTCLILRLGLRIEGGPLKLSLKDIHTLYEYWCYLAVLQLLAEQMGAAIDPSALLRVSSSGVRVELEKGRETKVVLSNTGQGSNGRNRPDQPLTVALTYNPSFNSPTGQHRPDVGLAINVEGWNTPFEVILDAKYRINTAADYISQHGSPGPPVDAVNALHRYRDAILVGRSQNGDSTNDASEEAWKALEKKRRIIVGAALFPFQDPAGEYEKHTFYRSLGSVGIGALPFLPSRKEYVRDWLRRILTESGWSLAERAPEHVVASERAQWMREATEPVLIAVIRPGVNQLEWIKENRIYFAPLARLGKRKFAARWVAIYEGRRDLGGWGAVTHKAEVLGIDVVPRSRIPTPWAPSHAPDELQVVYWLGDVQKQEPPIPVDGGMRSHRWASRLSLQRAQSGKELFLETEPEWRLYDELRAKGVAFELKSSEARILDPDDPRGRASFIVGPYKIRYDGAKGFLVERGGTAYLETSVARLVEQISTPL